MRLKTIVALVGIGCVMAGCASAKHVETRELKIDFPSLHIGTAENEKGPTGCTVLYFPKGAYGAIDIRGGAAAVREASSIDELNAWGYLDAIVLAGGSTYGLEAADGVMSELLKLRKGSTKFDAIPAVPTAIVYDFSGRTNAIYPDKELGREAFLNAKTGHVPVGKVGGGRFVTVGKYFGRAFAQPSGQGAAYYESGAVRILVVTVVNAVGNILDKKGNIIAGSYDEKTKTHFDIAAKVMEKVKSAPPKGKENTTITAVITNVKLERSDLKRLAVMTHTSMGRAIAPFHTPWDGDTLFAVSTREVDLPKDIEVIDIGTIATSLAHDAVIEAVK